MRRVAPSIEKLPGKHSGLGVDVPHRLAEQSRFKDTHSGGEDNIGWRAAMAFSFYQGALGVGGGTQNFETAKGVAGICLKVGMGPTEESGLRRLQPRQDAETIPLIHWDADRSSIGVAW